MRRVLIIAALLMGTALSVLAQHPVRLVYAFPQYAPGWAGGSKTEIKVHVKNVGTPVSRTVSVHKGSASSTTPWIDVPLNLTHTYADHSVYEGVIPEPSFDFVIRYVTDVGTYWDNNGCSGCHYTVNPSSTHENDNVGGGIGLDWAMRWYEMLPATWDPTTQWLHVGLAGLAVAQEEAGRTNQVWIHTRIVSDWLGASPWVDWPAMHIGNKRVFRRICG